MSIANILPPALSSNPAILHGILRGIEKEGLRVDGAGKLAVTPHPAILGSALAHPHITTDYSESLLELITGTHASVPDLLGELHAVHAFVAQRLDGELVWNQSMPAHLPAEDDIPIAWYGTSNTGMLRHVYRRGLAVRGSRTMQCIAGLHYNFSLPDAAWNPAGGALDKDTRSQRYMALIRNFTRTAWLLMYLFGASPAVSGDFLRRPGHGLEQLDDDTWYLPYATSLRMSDLGYRNQAQSELQLCYNDLPTFLQRMYRAVTTPWPAYQAIGTHRDGEWIQLNTNVLQIENEYYAIIRPKHPVNRGERPITVLADKGIQYVEVRCLDIDPFAPVGIRPETCHFLDTYLLFCALEASPDFGSDGFCQTSKDNFSLVTRAGRTPGLTLSRAGETISLQDWAHDLLDRMAPYAALLDQSHGGTQHQAALDNQRAKVRDVNLTPSAQLLQQLRASGLGFHDFSLKLSQSHHEALRQHTLAAEAQARLENQAKTSHQQQDAIEGSDTVDFDTYVRQYQAALRAPV